MTLTVFNKRPFIFRGDFINQMLCNDYNSFIFGFLCEQYLIVALCLFQETAEVCVGTSVGTITEPDCLGPCEPGTSVTLEGIVWHETEGGELLLAHAAP